MGLEVALLGAVLGTWLGEGDVSRRTSNPWGGPEGELTDKDAISRRQGINIIIS